MKKCPPCSQCVLQLQLFPLSLFFLSHNNQRAKAGGNWGADSTDALLNNFGNKVMGKERVKLFKNVIKQNINTLSLRKKWMEIYIITAEN